MTTGTTPPPVPPPSMARTAFSALVLLAGIVLLAKTVMVPTPDPMRTQPPSRTATRPVPSKPSSTRGRVPIRPLGGYRIGRLSVRTVGDRETPRRFSIAAEFDSYRADNIGADDRASSRDGEMCGVETVMHEKPEDGGGYPPAPPEFKIEGPRSPSPTSKQRKARRRKSGVDLEATARAPSDRKPTNRKSTRDTKRSKVAGAKPPSHDPPSGRPTSQLERQRLIMESSSWHVRGELSKAMQARRQRIQRCLDFYYDRPLVNYEDSPWSMMHHMIAWGIDSRIIIRTPENTSKPVSTIGWLCGNGVCDGHKLLFVEDGHLRARVGAGLQGHEGQFLAMLAQTRVSRNQRILVDGGEFTTEDLIREEQLGCLPRTELTFKLIGLSHYLPTDARWKNSHGQNWSMTRLVDEELRQPINGTTCGGTHRLMGFTYSLARRRMEGAPITGPWAKAEVVARRHQQLAFRMQNRDGSFSSDFFRSAGSWGDMNRKLKTTGHVLEWLVFSLPPDQLDDPRILKAVDFVTQMLTANRYYDWENGPLGHAIRALALYDERVYGRKPGKRDLRMAKSRPQLQPRTEKPGQRPPQPSRAANSRSPLRAFRRR